MEGKTAIIITAYNRFNALNNLLDTIGKIESDFEITLIISIDNNGTSKVNDLANDFKWRLGEKKVIIHKEKKGLRNHFIWVGDQTEIYDNVIFLEDDLIVSPHLIDFIRQAVEYYKNEDKVAGFSLYNPMLCEFDGCKFYQNQDGYDVYFLQHPYWGNVWLKKNWKEFKLWLTNYSINEKILPVEVANWKDSSFKKVFIQYLIENNKYMVIPRISLVSNNGEKGLHNTEGLYQYQVLFMNEKLKYRLCKIEDSKAVYDAFFELVPDILIKYNKDIASYDFEVDLRGIRRVYSKKYVLTTRKCTKIIYSFTKFHKPQENAIINSIQGVGINLSASENVVFEKNFKSKKMYNDIELNYVLDGRTKLFEAIDLIKIILKKVIKW